jgi:hypothetical protein
MSQPVGNKLSLRFGLGFSLLLFAVFILALNCRWLFAQGYARYSNEYLRHGVSGEQGLAAADLAIRLTPYASRYHVIRAGIFERDRRYEESLGALRSALTFGAHNPFIWQVYIRLKLRLNQFDDDLTQAIAQVHRLAPRSYMLHSENAHLGLLYWEWGKPEQRHLWASSIQFAHKTNSRSFARTVLQYRREKLFCAEFGAHLPGLGDWCKGALIARQICFTTPVKRGMRRWCRRLGFVQDSLNG